MGQMKKYNQIITEMPSKTVVFAFGRFQPPTTGHELLVKAVARLAQQKRADHVIIASKTQDKKKNPLTVERKVHYLRMMFPRINFMAANQEVRTFIEAAKMLNKKYKNIIMVAGSDRVAEFNRLLNQYNGKDFKFDTIEVISAGQRDPDADNAQGMSGTKMRQAAEKGNYIEFKKGLPSTMRDIDGRRLMNDIRMGLGMQAVREQVTFKTDDLREQYFQGKIFNIGDNVEDYDGVYQIVNRGSNHILVQEENGELVSKWIQDVKPTERTFMLNEALSQKTLKAADKIKVGRVIATMLGIENAESMSNPTQMVNMGLRNIRKKALNKAAIELIQKMIDLAKSMDIKYDNSLLPNALKEGVIQPNGTDKISVPTGSDSTVVVNKKSNRNAAKDVLRFSDFKKLQKVTEDDETKETESDMDAEFEYAKPETEVGGLMVPPYSETDDNLRRRKVNYRVHEEATAGSEAAAKRAQKEKQRAQLQIKQSKEKEALRARQEREREQMKNESETPEAKNARHQKDLDSLERDIRKSGQMDKDTEAHFNNKRKELKLASFKEGKEGLKDACWAGYEAIGMKDKDGKKVPNCVPKKKAVKEESEQIDEISNRLKGHYIARAALDVSNKSDQAGSERAKGNYDNSNKINKKVTKRLGNIAKASYSMQKEEDELDEDAFGSKPSDNKKVHVLKYNNKGHEKHGSLSQPMTKTAAQIRARMGNERDKVGGTYTIHKMGPKGHISEALDLDEMCARDAMTQGVDPIDVDDVTSSINPPHDEEFVNSGVEHTDDVGSYAKDINVLDFSTEAELNDIVNSMSDDEIVELAYEDDEVEEIDEDGEVYEMDDEEKELDESLRLVEGLSRMERMKARMRLRRTAAKRKRATKISMKRISSSKTANLRARRAAIKKLKQRVLRGRSSSQLSHSEKERVEKFVASKKNLINRLAMKMLPRVRQIEKKRIANARKK